MKLFSDFLMVALIAAVIENTILTKALGTSTLIVAVKSKRTFLGFSISIIYISTTSSILSYFADKFLLDKPTSFLFMPFIYVLCIGIVYIVTLLSLWKWWYSLFIEIKKYIHFSAFNCAVLGCLFINSTVSDSFVGYLILGFSSGLGFFIASFLVQTCYDKLTSSHIPACFRGFPIMMIYIGILSMVLFALVENMSIV